MIQTRGRKIIADILSRKSRTFLAALSIAIGVFGLSLLMGMADILVAQLRQDLNPDQIGMLKQYLVLPQGQLSLAENQAILAELAQQDGVQQIEGQAIYPIAWQTSTADSGAAFNDSNLLSYTQPFGEIALEPPAEVVEGRYPEAGQQELAIERRLGRFYDMGVGDTIRVRMRDGELADWTIVGILYHPFVTVSTSRNNDLPAQESFFAHYEDAQAITGFKGLSSIYVRYETFEDAKAHRESFAAAVAQQTPYIPVFTFMEDPDDIFIIGNVTQVSSVLQSLAVLAMVVSGFLVVNIINTIIVEQRQQIGIMKSIGASGWDIVRIYGGTAFVYGILGTGVGILLALPLTSYLAASIASTARTYIGGFKISQQGLAWGVGLGLTVPVLVSIIPVLNGVRVSILEAITDFGIGSTWGGGRVARLLNSIPLPLSLRQALSNILQKSGRLALTGFTLTLATASFLAVTAVLSSVGSQISTFFDRIGYEVRIEPQSAEDVDRMVTILSQTQGISRIYTGYTANVGLLGYEETDDIRAGTNQIEVIGVDPIDSAFEFDLLEGEGWENDPQREGVLISSSLADLMNKGLGDRLTILINEQAYELEIIGVDNSTSDEITSDWRKLASLTGYVNAAGEPVPNRLYLDMTEDDPSVAAVDAQIAQIQTAFLAEGITANFLNQPENEAVQVGFLDVFALIFYIMAGVMAAVGGVGLLAVLSMAVFERQKEIGVMRSIGAGSSTILSQFLAEGVLIAAFAWLLALPFSYVFGSFLLDTLPFNGVYFSYPAIVVIYGLVGSLGVAVVASLSPALAASRKTVSDILRYQ